MAAARNSVADLLAAKEMVLVCGSGGTGKTTVSAALGAQAAIHLGGRVLVLTVDPARRLSAALGIGPLGGDPVRVDPARLSGGGPAPRGELWVAMLDTKAGWDELIRRHATDDALAQQVLANPLYRNITSRFVHSHDYLAMERLHDLHASGEYDLVIIDTPPSRNALDLLDAPGRMSEFFGSRLLRWLTVPYRSRLFTVASKPFYQVADRVLGSRFLQDIADFFILFQSMEPGFTRRANEVAQLLTDQRTTFVVVSTLEAAPAHEAAFLADELRRRKMPLGALVLNRTVPAAVRAPATAKASAKLREGLDDAEWMAELARSARSTSKAVVATIAAVTDRFDDIAIVAAREAERRAELATLTPTVVDVPTLPSDVHDLEGVLAIGRHAFGRENR